MDSRMASTATGTTTFVTVETVSLPVESSEKRARRRKVSEGHNTTPAAKSTKNAENPTSNNNRLERRKASSSSSATSSTARPACSYTTMIMEVFQASSKVKLDLPDIYSGIMDKYPFYRKAGKVWQSSVRHALSQSKFFCKLERGPGEPGKGSLWIIDTENKQTPNHSRKRKASGGNLGANDYVSAHPCPTTHSRVAHSLKLACTTIGESFVDEKSRGLHSSAASIPSPAASDDVDDGGTVRRSGRARRPPRTKEADDYITTASHSRKPSLVAGASLSTPPSSPAPQDHPSEANARTTSPPPPSRRRSSSIRSDRSVTGPAVSRMSHFTIDLPHYSPTISAPATPTVFPGALPRRAPLDQELASIPGVVTSPRVRRPPQKLAEFVSSEDFKAAPCGKRPSLVSASSSSSFTSRNQDRAATAAATTATPGGEAGQRIEKRGRKRALPDGDRSASSLQQQQKGDSDGTVTRSNRRANAVNGGRTKNAAAPARQQNVSSLPAPAPTAKSPVGSVTGSAPAFISLKDLELSHAGSLEEDYDDEDDYFGTGGRNNNRDVARGVSLRRNGGGKPVCQNETYEQRRLAGIQQIVVASLDWYDESDSEDDEEEDVGMEGDSDIDMGDINDESAAVVGRVGGGGTTRSGCDSGFDSESESCKGFVREAGWMMTAEATELAEELDIDNAASSQALERCQSEAFETVCIAPAEVLAVGGAVASHFLDLTGAGLVVDQDGDGLQPSSVAIDESSLLPIISGDVPSPLGDMIESGTGVVESGQPAPAWALPMIPGGVLKELAAVTAAALEVGGDKSVCGVEDIAGPMEVELEEHGGDATVYIEAATTTVAAATASETTEMRADNYMGWLNL
ncbi:Forkhead box protein J3 [Mortierella hygrophila]|uniref:Forkhead box protein J3 n=1 Tax=Mortierella hygrophila TaxID=979708 RepID=A0A9P6FC77_9FUNG|nr:Forkhead box protein J3 [Mortierella hygrophila]